MLKLKFCMRLWSCALGAIVQSTCKTIAAIRSCSCFRVFGCLNCCSKVGTHNGVYCWLNKEVCGLFCGLITDILLIFAIYACNTHVLRPWLGYSFVGLVLSLLFNSTCILAIYCHLKTMCCDPGSVPADAAPLSDDEEENDYEVGNRNIPFKKYCRKCKAFKPIRAHHCSLCGRCIVKMDHHCPWVNNCVGIGNQKFFILFLLWTFVSCIFTLAIILVKFIDCSIGNEMKAEHCSDPQIYSFSLVLTIEGVLFAIFTFIMLMEQYKSISSNTTKISRLKLLAKSHSAVEDFEVSAGLLGGNDHTNNNLNSSGHDDGSSDNDKGRINNMGEGINKPALIEINELFGAPASIKFQWMWLLPISFEFSGPIRDKIHGYKSVQKINKTHHFNT